MVILGNDRQLIHLDIWREEPMFKAQESGGQKVDSQLVSSAVNELDSQ